MNSNIRLFKKFDLQPMNNQKSYYGKAKVYSDQFANTYLVSYKTFICVVPKDDYNNKSFVLLNKWDTPTTTKHVKSFIACMTEGQYDSDDTKSYIDKLRKQNPREWLMHDFCLTYDKNNEPVKLDNRNEFCMQWNKDLYEDGEKAFRKGGAWQFGKSDAWHKTSGGVTHWYSKNPDGQLAHDKVFYPAPKFMEE